MGRSSRAFHVVAGAIVIALVVLSTFVFVGAPDPGRTNANTNAGTVTERNAGDPARTPIGLDGFEDSVEPSRVRASQALLVVDELQAPIAGCELAWMDVRKTDVPSETGPAGVVRGRNSWTSDGEGRFREAAKAESMGQRSIAWITHPRYAARYFIIEPGQSLAGLPSPITLRSTEGIVVSVVDDVGSPVANAWVTQRFEILPEQGPSLDADEFAARLSYSKSARSDLAGEARFGYIPGRQSIDAVLGDDMAMPWRGSAPASVRMRIGRTIPIGGRVVSEGGNVVLSQLVVRVSVRVESVNQVIGQSRVHSDGTIATFRVPWVDAERYDFELSGSDCVPVTVRRSAHEVHDGAELAFVATRGTKFPVRVLSDESVPLRGAIVRWAWSVGEVWQWWSGGTDDDGMCQAHCIPRGMIWLEISKPGFLPFKQELEQVGDFAPAYEVRLVRGGVLRGVVRAGGEPASDFRIIVTRAQDNSPDGVREHEFTDRKEGAYELDGVPIGEIEVFAYSSQYQRSASHVVHVEPGMPVMADFDLPLPVEVKARIVDAQSFEPIARAVVQGWMSSRVATLRSWGATAESGTDGKFVLACASPDAAVSLRVEADGYAPVFRVVRSREGKPVDLGIIGLSRPRDFELRVMGDELAPTNSIHASMRGMHAEARRSADAEGRIRFEGVRPDAYTVTVDWGSSASYSFATRLGSADTSSMDFDLRRGHDVFVVVRTEDGVGLAPGCVLQAAYWSLSAKRLVLWNDWVPDSSRIDIGRFDSDRVVLQVLDPTGKTIGAVRIPDLARAGPEVVLRLGGKGHTLRVLDRDDRPLARASVSIGRSAGVFERFLNTDANGIVELPSFDGDEMQVIVDVPFEGCALYRSVSLSDRPTDLRFDPHEIVGIRLLDGAEPLPGILVQVFHGHGFEYLVDELVSDDQGEARTRRVSGSDDYVLRIEQPGIWPVNSLQKAHANSSTTAVQVRRIGSTVLRARRSGLAVAGQSVTLRSEEFGEDVEMWRSSGRCVVTPSDFRTDVQGRIRIDGIPHGSYRWSATIEPDITVGGRFEVLPNQRVDVDLAVP